MARLLFDINHPVHVHLLRDTIHRLLEEGHDCRVVARDKDVTLRLLDHYLIPYRVLAPLGRSTLGRLRELLSRELGVLALARSFRPGLLVGTSAHAARVAKLLGAKSVVLNDDDAEAVPLFRWLAYPLATAIVTPECLRHEDHGPRQLTYRAYQQLFYLHPDRFTPDPEIRASLGLGPGETYAIVRLSALEAHHDQGKRGLSPDLLRRVRERAAGRGIRLFVSSEKPLQGELAALRLPCAPERMHDALAFAELYLGDSQSVTAEAAVLGTPAFRINDFVGRISYLRELEGYGLAFGFKPEQEALLLEALDRVLALPDRRATFEARRRAMLAEKVDPLPWFLDLLRGMLRG